MNSFLISTNNAKGPGFGMFSLTHLVTLAVLALLIAGIVRSYCRADENQRRRYRCGIAVLVLVMELIKDLLLMLTGQFTNANWPFELCGLALFMIAADALQSSKTTRELLYSLALPGALMAELTPNWVKNDFVNIFVWQSFLIHAFIIAYVLMRLFAREIVPSWRNLWRCAVFLLIVCPLNFWLNSIWGTNFMFLDTPSPGSPLEPLGQIFGSYYLLGFVGLLLVFWLVMYLPWEIVRIWAKRKN
ncbi:YwaF family protein [Lactovum odontotermitis]